MNRAQRRAERFTKRGRLDQAERERHICEHGNPKKTDGNGNPMCPHGCGFATVEDMPPACPHCRLIGGGHTHSCITQLPQQITTYSSEPKD